MRQPKPLASPGILLFLPRRAVFGFSRVGTRCFAFLVSGGVTADVKKRGKEILNGLQKPPGKNFGEAMQRFLRIWAKEVTCFCPQFWAKDVARNLRQEVTLLKQTIPDLLIFGNDL